MITKSDKYCLICGRPKDHIHHLIGGSYRRQCDADHLVIPLCFEHHEAIHRSGVAEQLSKIIGQMQWEQEHRKDGEDPEKTRERFRETYGRSWL